jgi:hypothetical protein
MLPANAQFINSHNNLDSIVSKIKKTTYTQLYTNIKLPEEFKVCKDFKNLDQLLVAYLADRLNPIFVANGTAKAFDTFDDRNRFIFGSDNRWFVDVSDLGKGKTHNTADINPNQYAHKRIIFLKNKKFDRNTETLDGFVPFPARHRGLIRDGIESFDGSPSFRRAKRDEIPDIEANCVNPVMPCSLCDHKRTCTKGTNPFGFNARHEINQSKDCTRILAHPLSLQSIELRPDDIVIVDEASALLELTQTVAFDDNMRALVDYLSISGHHKMPFSEQEVDQWDFDTIKEKCREQLAFSDDNLNVEHLLMDESRTDLIDGDLMSVLKFINIVGNDKSFFDAPSSTVMSPNEALIAELDKAGKVILLDATCNVAIFRMFGIDVTPVKVGHAGIKTCNGNLTIHCMEGLPKINNMSTDFDKREINKVRDKLASDYGDTIGFVAPKVIAKENDIVTFVNSRGSNLLQNKKVVACLATPTINLGAARLSFNALFYPLTYETAPHVFSEYYSSLNDSELLQIAGRTRFTRRLTEDLKFYIVSEPWKLQWIKHLGMKIHNPNKKSIGKFSIKKK